MAASSHCVRCRQPISTSALFCSQCGLSTHATINQRGAPRAAGELPPGTLLFASRRYRIERSLGRGGFGETYLATDAGLKQRKCVIKRMLVDPAWSGAEERIARDNFRREAELLADLNTPGHPNIPEIYEYLHEEACLVMKYIEGKSLNQGGMPAGRILDCVRDICSALTYMHGRVPPVLHRDIKPANILLADNGHVWLIDFGLSKSAPIHAAAPQNSATMMSGTPGYTPPEQWQNAAVPQSDVYALAATLHTLLTRHAPAFTDADLPALIDGRAGQFPPVRDFDPDVDPRIERLIQRGMDFNPAARPTAGQFLAEVMQILRTSGSRPAVHNRRGARITTPDGDHVSTTEGLALWCADNWGLAREWLLGNLPDVIETSFLDARLAQSVRSARDTYPDDANAALDFVIELLANGQRSWAIRFAPNPVDFGSLALDGKPVARQVTIKNTGQRYLSLRLNGDDWVRVSNARARPGSMQLALLPGTEQRVTLYADPAHKRVGGRLGARLAVPLPNGMNETLEVVASLPRWKTLWARSVAPRLRRRSRTLLRRRPAQAYVVLAMLLLLAGLYLWLHS
ncbi:MAG TPA: serine/threonine-protein kinase [Herpetosiphonaceae bacterium]|nr:serine/threonine-protein kinase [Herpetosiphonaceae bacterium]